MGQDIKKFNAEEAMNSVKDKIKDAFVSLIPDEQWNEMVKTEVNKYFAETEDYNGYSNRQRTSGFSRTVFSLLDSEVNIRVTDYLKENFQLIWYNSNGEAKCNAKVEEMITKNAGQILADMIGASIQMRLQQAGFNII